MNSANVAKLLEQARAEHVFSAYQLFSEHEGQSLDLSGGIQSYWQTPEKNVDSATYFDIGSLTKPIVGVSLLARAIQHEAWTLDSPVSDWLRSLSSSELGKLRLEQLLSHSSGLKAWLPIYQSIGKKSLLDWFQQNSTELWHDQKNQAVYSDLNFLLLGEVLKSHYGDLKSAFHREVAVPLKMNETCYGELDSSVPAVATEYREFHQGPLHRVVFDDNCLALGGVTAHAGLFSTARSLSKFCRAWLGLESKEWLTEKVRTLFTTRVGQIPQSSWALGWDTKSETHSSCGSYFSPKSFGHLGYPGCSLWLDPVNNSYAVFLSNRIHPSRYDDRIRRLRPQLHDCLAKQWSQK